MLGGRDQRVLKLAALVERVVPSGWGFITQLRRFNFIKTELRVTLLHRLWLLRKLIKGFIQVILLLIKYFLITLQLTCLATVEFNFLFTVDRRFVANTSQWSVVGIDRFSALIKLDYYATFWVTVNLPALMFGVMANVRIERHGSWYLIRCDVL